MLCRTAIEDTPLQAHLDLFQESTQLNLRQMQSPPENPTHTDYAVNHQDHQWLPSLQGVIQGVAQQCRPAFLRENQVIEIARTAKIIHCQQATDLYHQDEAREEWEEVIWNRWQALRVVQPLDTT